MGIKEAIPLNLRRIRQQKGWAQEEVATKAAMSLSGYRKIEAGESVPNVVTLDKLTRVLGIALQELIEPTVALKHVRFRRLRKLQLKSREQVLVDVGRWYSDYCKLEELVGEIADYKFKSMDFKGSGTERAKEAALFVRKSMGMGDDPVQDPCGLLERTGVKLLKTPVATDGFFGLSIADQDCGPAIVVNVWHRISVERWIFSAFHELGHLLLHGQDYEKPAEMDEEKETEREADAFASYFLMPETSFRRKWERTGGDAFVDRVLKVKRVFKVSYSSVLFRLRQWYPKENLFMLFNVEYKNQTGGSLKDHFEPEPKLKPSDFDCKMIISEVQPLSRYDFWEDRLFRLVRHAVQRELITLGRAAEILNVPLERMRSISATWEFDKGDQL